MLCSRNTRILLEVQFAILNIGMRMIVDLCQVVDGW